MATKGIAVTFLSESARIIKSPSSGFHIWVTRCRLTESTHHLKGPVLSRSFGVVTDGPGNEKDVKKEAPVIPGANATSHSKNSQISNSDLTDDCTHKRLIVAKDFLSTTTSTYIKSSQDLKTVPEEKLAEISELFLEFQDKGTKIHDLLKDFDDTHADDMQEIWKQVMQGKDVTTNINQLLTDLSMTKDTSALENLSLRARVRSLEEGAKRDREVLLEIRDLLKGKNNAVEEGSARTENLNASKEILQEMKKYKDIKTLDEIELLNSLLSIATNEGLQAVSQLLLDFLKGKATKAQLKEAMGIFWKKTCIAVFKRVRIVFIFGLIVRCLWWLVRRCLM